MDLPVSTTCRQKAVINKRLLWTTIALLQVFQYGWAISGPCRNKLPCKAGSLQGDPTDCTVYWECLESRQDFNKSTCDSGFSFDRKEKRCKESDVKCTRPCDPVDESGFFPSIEIIDTGRTISPTLEVDLVNIAMDDLTTAKNPAVPIMNETNAVTTSLPDKIIPENGDVPPAANTTEKVPEITAAPDVISNQTTASASAAASDRPTTAKPPQTTTAGRTMTATSEKQTTEAPIVIDPGTPSPKPDATPRPPYVVVTDGPELEGTTRGNASAIGPGDQVGPGPAMSGATIGIIVGVVAGVVILVTLVLLIIFLIRRRKQRKDGKIIRMENPQYSQPSREQNFRFSRDSALFVGPTVSMHPNGLSTMNNNSPGTDRRKRLAPPAPGSTGSASPSSSMNRSKRQAPPPPNPFTGAVDDDDLYEKESQGSSVELSTFTARNDKTSLRDALANAEDEEPDTKASQPLVSKTNGQLKAEADDSSSSEEDLEETGSPGVATSPEQSLLRKKNQSSKDNMSVDSYDIEKNPFFDG